MMLEYLDEYIAPHFEHLCASTSVQIKEQLPVFAVSVMIIPSDDCEKTSQETQAAVVALSISHALGDGVTYFQMLKQLSMYMNRESGHQDMHIPSIDWNFRSQTAHELYPAMLSWRDIEVSYGLPFFIGLVKNAILTFQKRKPSILLLDKSKVKLEKLRLRELLNSTSISSNDVVSLALCQSNPDVDIFVFTENARDDDRIPRNAGGNFYWEIPFSSQAALSDPRHFRSSVEHQASYPSGQLPIEPFLNGRVGRLTSLATVSEQLNYEGVETLCTLPVKSFLRTIPMDVAMIFRFNKRCLGVLHNFVHLESGVLDSLLVREESTRTQEETLPRRQQPPA
jgi:hypothetical protein